ncbi:uncharacterized protein LOC142356871, partial [Convolutriloba macropyga]|uniref:uncharacterized protein LOC142356871 n=1 Tax=Convolutriloba macropyga TaxID=536237 RepID=UPI003F51B21F
GPKSEFNLGPYGFLNFLVAQTTYSFTLSGPDTNLGGLQSLESTPVQFTTPNAARLDCTVAGSMIYQIEFEGVPDVQSYSTTREIVFSTPGGTTKSSGDVQDVCEEDECFHFAAGSGFPTVNEFRGYPIAFE